MNYLNSLLKSNNRQHLYAVVLLTVYILFDVRTPKFIAVLVDSLAGNLAVAGLVVAMLCNGDSTHSRVICGLGMIAAYELVRRSSLATGSYGVRKLLPSEEKKGRHFSAFNQFPVTLEEEAVNSMEPVTTHSPDGQAGYKPVLDAGGSDASLL